MPKARRRYTASVHVAPGTGDYGTRYRTLFHGRATADGIKDRARAIAREHAAPVSVFRWARDVGRLLFTVDPDGREV